MADKSLNEKIEAAKADFAKRILAAEIEEQRTKRELSEAGKRHRAAQDHVEGLRLLKGEAMAKFVEEMMKS